MNKRGISPLIATVLLIGFTIVIAALVITFGTNLIRGNIEDTQKETTLIKLCSEASITAKLKQAEAPYSQNLEVIVINNNENSIEGLVFNVKNTQEGTSGVISSHDIIKTGQYLYYAPQKEPTEPLIGAFVNKKFILSNGWDPGFTNYDEIEVRPIVKDTTTNELKACSTPIAKAKKD